MTDLIGQSLGRYHILEQIGEGGMAVVYKAYDIRLETDVAVKFIRTERLTPDIAAKALKRFEREAKALAKLTHPNIVSILDYGEYEGHPYLVMKYLPGGTLKQRLQGKRMDWREAINLVLPVARALAYAHSEDIIHRDIKPSNILITRSGEPMLTDFGVAKLFDNEETADLTGTGMGIGTPGYMAPEQFQGQVGAQADVYAFGVVLYEVITGRRPYSADTPAAIIVKQVTEPLPRPSLYAEGLPDAVEKMLLKALARNVAERYASMTEFVSVMEKLVGGTQAGAIEKERARPVATPVLAGADPDATVKEMAGAKPTEKFVIPGRLVPVHAPKPAGLNRNVTGGIAVLLTLVCMLGVSIMVGIGLGLGRKGQGPFAGLMSITTNASTITPTLSSTPTAELVIGSTEVREADGMLMDYVPAGEFTMGSTNGNEKPIHITNLDAYWIDQTEVTNGMFALCVSSGACQPPDSNSSSTRSNYYNNSQFADFPVIYVSWNNAKAYCVWAGADLPSEAQWEKAARGEDGRIYPWGNQSPLNTLLNYNSSVGDTTLVGKYPNGASPYGALDMAGNVWEWVNDWYDDFYHINSPSSNPTGPASGSSRVLRGGSWSYFANFVRSSYRYRLAPDDTGNEIGFRCSRSAASP